MRATRMTRKVESLWEHLIELIVACPSAAARNALTLQSLVVTGRALSAAIYRRRDDGEWEQESRVGDVGELPTAAEVGARVESEAPAAAWPAGMQCVDGSTAGERWVLVGQPETRERTRDELEAVLILMRVCASAEVDLPLDSPLENAGTALPEEARHAADLDRERERTLHAARALVRDVAARLGGWSDDLDAEQRLAHRSAIDAACAEAVRTLAERWERG